ncbi:ABC transporter ATP-binding protein/permease [Corynebacterium sp. TAE3-ERU12]|uniref:ABC transporter ATP-binding protein n=1 Tax=Corynebacterium sp. TAE3-ERU12 TaxID=2849491 RepID=UPI001C45F819|nr:ABC transporter ATP-binding protein [Corynebacterium sp. TAE3-ERU12]MBV7295571.1 ABC transporter ATP-binding protein/permease [Corynebacterium sp. TAE3-ERU12]
MNVASFNAVQVAKRLSGDPEGVNRLVRWGVAVGIAEGLGLVALLPALTALATGEEVLGLGFVGWVIVLAVLAIVGAVAYLMRQFVGYTMAMNFMNNLHRLVGDQISRLPLGWFAKANAGAISRSVSGELMMAGEILALTTMTLVGNTVSIIVVIIGSFLWDWRLGLVMLLSIPLFALLVTLNTKWSKTADSIADPPTDELSNRVIEFATRQQALRATGQSTNYPELLEANENWYRSLQRSGRYKAAGAVVGTVFTQIVIVLLIIIAAWLTLSGAMSPIEGLVFIGMALRFTQMVDTIVKATLAMEERRRVTDRLDDILTAKPLPEPETSAQQPTPGSVELADVTFGYEEDTPVLRDVSFQVPANTMCALVGPSGCGKTTVARLISRFYEVDYGAVKVGGVEIGQLTTEDLMSQLSMVFQDVYLFDDTLEANIRVGKFDATTEEIEEAARLAGVTEIVDRLPEGWHTPVGEGGRALSGGERQRVAIARALLKQAPIVLFDEATSALDPENEDNIIAATEKLREHATLIVIAHKLDTIARADQIVQFTADGRVEGVGTHDELLRSGGTYQKFWRSRSAAQGWRLS